MARQKEIPDKKRRNIYIAAEEVDFIWDEQEVEEVKEMLKLKIPPELIASNFGRPEIEIKFLLMDLEMKAIEMKPVKNKCRICDKPHYSKGLCHAHYRRERYHENRNDMRIL